MRMQTPHAETISSEYSPGGAEDIHLKVFHFLAGVLQVCSTPAADP
jgi:hypothetical protein